MEHLRVSLDLSTNFNGRMGNLWDCEDLTSFIARRKFSMPRLASPRGGEVCNKTLPRATDAGYATLKVTRA